MKVFGITLAVNICQPALRYNQRHRIPCNAQLQAQVWKCPMEEGLPDSDWLHSFAGSRKLPVDRLQKVGCTVPGAIWSKLADGVTPKHTGRDLSLIWLAGYELSGGAKPLEFECLWGQPALINAWIANRNSRNFNEAVHANKDWFQVMFGKQQPPWELLAFVHLKLANQRFAYVVGLSFPIGEERMVKPLPAVIMMLRDCAPKGTKYHIYGFNWPGGQWPAHKVKFRVQNLRKFTIIVSPLCKHARQKSCKSCCAGSSMPHGGSWTELF